MDGTGVPAEGAVGREADVDFVELDVGFRVGVPSQGDLARSRGSAQSPGVEGGVPGGAVGVALTGSVGLLSRPAVLTALSLK
jgi:hypothetical protein